MKASACVLALLWIAPALSAHADARSMAVLEPSCPPEWWELGRLIDSLRVELAASELRVVGDGEAHDFAVMVDRPDCSDDGSTVEIRRGAAAEIVELADLDPSARTRALALRIADFVSVADAPPAPLPPPAPPRVEEPAVELRFELGGEVLLVIEGPTVLAGGLVAAELAFRDAPLVVRLGVDLLGGRTTDALGEVMAIAGGGSVAVGVEGELEWFRPSIRAELSLRYANLDADTTDPRVTTQDEDGLFAIAALVGRAAARLGDLAFVALDLGAGYTLAGFVARSSTVPLLSLRDALLTATIAFGFEL
jgi:hypothetical protein